MSERAVVDYGGEIDQLTVARSVCVGLAVACRLSNFAANFPSPPFAIGTAEIVLNCLCASLLQI